MSDLTRALWVRISNALYREDGQALTEYALVIALLAVVATIVTSATGVGSTIVNKIAVELAKIDPSH
jgi:Flp pilus assembly pilin Flp